MFRVKKEQCETCIFRPGNPMHLEPRRLKQLIEETKAADSFITCHETLDIWNEEAPEREGELEAACRGYLDTGAQPQLYRIAQRLGIDEGSIERPW